jgi:FtsH-binding integral membrane protein
MKKQLGLLIGLMLVVPAAWAASVEPVKGVSQVPEPATVVLLIVGFLGLLWVRRRIQS